MKKDFVPDENFEWGIDLESMTAGKKKKKKADPVNIPIVIK